jgi:hypothetical protein
MNGIQLRWPAKHPADVLDYAVDWTKPLEELADTIATATWSVPSGLVEGAAGGAGAVRTLWLSGGTAGISYTLTHTITTAGGRTLARTILLDVVQ